MTTDRSQTRLLTPPPDSKSVHTVCVCVSRCENTCVCSLDGVCERPLSSPGCEVGGLLKADLCVFVLCQDAIPSGFSSCDVLIPLADEYDPMFPNDYEKVVKRHREERQRQREQERQKEIEEREKYGSVSSLTPQAVAQTLAPTGFEVQPQPSWKKPLLFWEDHRFESHFNQSSSVSQEEKRQT